jgi:aromatic ring-opening dioxygenase catalytic subunit (LigB family)
MAEIVCALGVPHTPNYPALVAREGPDCTVARLYAAVRGHLEAVSPDAIVIFDSDHINTFFFDNWPTFAVGATERFVAPNDDNSALPRRPLSGHPDLGLHIHTGVLTAGFDPSLSQRFEVDHSILVPLHFLTPSMNVPVVPIFINGLAPPLPAAKRCYALGQAVRETIEAWPSDVRVAVIGSGSFSLEVSGPRIRAGAYNSGVPDKEWVKRVCRHLAAAQIDELLEETTTDRIARAGNVAGEILNWIAMLGVLGRRTPSFIEPDAESGHAFGAWRWD